MYTKEKGFRSTKRKTKVLQSLFASCWLPHRTSFSVYQPRRSTVVVENFPRKSSQIPLISRATTLSLDELISSSRSSVDLKVNASKYFYVPRLKNLKSLEKTIVLPIPIRETRNTRKGERRRRRTGTPSLIYHDNDNSRSNESFVWRE